MSVYIFIMILSLIFASVVHYKLSDKDKIICCNLKVEKLLSIVLIFLMTIVMAFRTYNIGTDTLLYLKIFNYISKSSLVDALQNSAVYSAPLYVLFCKFCSVLWDDYRMILIATALFINIGMYRFINKVSANMPLSIFCYIGLSCFYISMNASRQFMAIVLVINGLIYLVDNLKSFKGWCLLFLSLGFHITGLVSLIVVLGIFISKKFNDLRKMLLSSAIFSVLTAVCLKNIVYFILVFIPRYAMYVNGKSKFNIFDGTGQGRIIILYAFLLLICLLWFYKSNDLNSVHSRVFPRLIFCSIFGIVFCKSELLNRVLLFFIPLYITFIPAIIKEYQGIYKTIIFWSVSIVLFTYSTLVLINNHGNIVPYEFVF